MAHQSLHHSARTRQNESTSTSQPAVDKNDREEQDPLVQGVKATCGFFLLCVVGSVILIALLLASGNEKKGSSRRSCLFNCGMLLPDFHLLEIPLEAPWAIRVYISGTWVFKDTAYLELWEGVVKPFDMEEALDLLADTTYPEYLVPSTYAITPVNLKIPFALLVTSLALVSLILASGGCYFSCGGRGLPGAPARRQRGNQSKSPFVNGAKPCLTVIGLATVFSSSAIAFSAAKIAKAITELKENGASRTARFGSTAFGFLGATVGMQIAAVLFFVWFLWLRLRLQRRNAKEDRTEELGEVMYVANDIELRETVADSSMMEPPPPYTPSPPVPTEDQRHK